MEQGTSLAIEVAYAKADCQRVLTLQVPLGTSVEAAIKLSGILQEFPEIDLTQHAVGIFSEKTTLETIVKAGDRIEIYRPLLMDPKDARFQLVKARRKERARQLTNRLITKRYR